MRILQKIEKNFFAKKSLKKFFNKNSEMLSQISKEIIEDEKNM